LLHLSTIKKSL